MLARMERSEKKSKRRIVLVPWFGVCVAVLACAGVSMLERGARQQVADESSRRIAGELREHLRVSAQMILALGALVDASEQVTRDEWHRFVSSFDLPQSNPEILVAAHWLPGPDGEAPLLQFSTRGDDFDDGFHDAARREVAQLARSRADTTLSAPRRIEVDGARRTVLLMAGAFETAAGPAYVGLILDAERLLQRFLEDSGGLLRAVWDADADPGVALIAGNAGREGAAAGAQTLSLYGRQWALDFEPGASGFLPGPWSVSVILIGLLLSLMLYWHLRTEAKVAQTARRIAQDQTRATVEAEAHQRAILDSSAEGILTINGSGVVQSFNRAAELMFGYRAEDVIGRNVTMLMPDRYRARHDALVAGFRPEVDHSVIGLRRDVTGQRIDGTEFPMSLAVNIVEGQEPRCFVGVISDLTERRQSEARLEEAHRLRDAILDAATFSIIATDPEGLIRAVNPAAEQLLRYPKETLVGGLALVDLVEPGELRSIAAAMSRELACDVEPGFQVFRAKADRGLPDEGEWRFRRNGGTSVPVQLAMSAMRDADDRITGYLGIAYDVTERKRREEYVRYLAHHDTLTGLPNRNLLGERVDTEIRQARLQGHSVAVLLVDLDHFKRINDSLGHHVGDELLATVAQRLSVCVPDSDGLVARMGGDEFVLLLRDLPDEAALHRKAQALVETLSQPIAAGAHELHVTASIGIARFPSDGDDAGTLLKHADAAMYRAKSDGRSCYRLFSLELQRRARDRLELEGAIRKGLANDEFRLQYEAQVDMLSGAVIGMEALLRWRHPQFGMLSPDEYIPIAEDTGLILPLGEWVLRTACREAVAIERRCGSPLRLSVNLSPRQLTQCDLHEIVCAALGDSGFPAERLTLEITENSLIKEPVEAIAILQRLRKLGVCVAVDDFGTGYSSLSYIHRFPVDALKIDRSFVRDVTIDSADAAIVRAIVAMAHSLDLQVIAEGVETFSQLEFLRRHGCDSAQGWLISRSVSAEDFSTSGLVVSAAYISTAGVGEEAVEPRLNGTKN